LLVPVELVDELDELDEDDDELLLDVFDELPLSNWLKRLAVPGETPLMLILTS
jgi:hypothetical protein